jgi:hypothetical protein
MFLKNTIPFVLYEDVDNEVRNKYQCHIDGDKHATYVKLVHISLKLQIEHENMNVHIIITHLKELFDATSRTERYETSKELFYCKMTEGLLMNTHVLRMIDYFKKLGQLGFAIDHESSVDLILQFMPKSLLRASRMTRELIIIVAKKATIGGPAKIILQPKRLKSLLKLLLYVSL